MQQEVLIQETPLKPKHSASDALRRLADLCDELEARGLVVGPPMEVSFARVQEDLATAAGVARVLGTCRKHFSNYTFSLAKDLGGVTVQFIWSRNSICERVVVGKKQVAEQVIPAHEEEIVEWRCPGALNAVAKSPQEALS